MTQKPSITQEEQKKALDILFPLESSQQRRCRFHPTQGMLEPAALSPLTYGRKRHGRLL